MQNEESEKQRPKKADGTFDVEAYLAEIRANIARSNELVRQAGLRIQETDRFLAKQGLTREQVLKMRFTQEQREAVNAELVRQGLQPLENVAPADDVRESFAAAREDVRAGMLEAADDSSDFHARQRKFDNFMQTYRL